MPPPPLPQVLPHAPFPEVWCPTFTWASTEPPYYELIQAAGDGITSPKLAGNILYYGLWETDMAARLEKLKQQKIGLDALFKADADSPPTARITAPALMGARIEYVDVSAKPAIEEWVRTGKFAGSGQSCKGCREQPLH